MRKCLDLAVIMLWLVSLGVLSCRPKPSEPLRPAVLTVFPPPPSPPRVQYLTRFSSSRDVAVARPSFLQRLVGDTEGQRSSAPIIKPYGVAVRGGKIYICDTILAGVEVIDLERQTFEYFQPRGMGRLRQPINCFVDEEGSLFVTDTERGQVVVFDSAGQYVDGLGDVEGGRPTDVFVEPDRIWVADIRKSEIRIYDKRTREFIGSMPNIEAGAPGALYSPANIYVAGERVYVSDFGDFKVKVYTREGGLLQEFGGYGNAPGSFLRPKGITVDRDLNVYVVDAAFENVQIFDRDGQLLMSFGGPYEGPGYMSLPAKVVVDYDNLSYFEQYVDERFDLKHLIFVTNQYGPDKLTVYGFVGPSTN